MGVLPMRVTAVPAVIWANERTKPVSETRRTMRCAFVLLLTLAAAGCTAQPKTADDVLRAYRERVYSELLPRIGREPINRELAAGIAAARILLPEKPLLFAKVKADLARLPSLRFQADEWETIAERTEYLEMAVEARRNLSKSAPTPIDPAAFPFAVFWDPQITAREVRRCVVMMGYGPEQYQELAEIETLLPPAVYAISADPVHPILVYETGPELFIVELRRTKDGYYVDEKIQWLRKKGPTSQPATTTGK